MAALLLARRPQMVWNRMIKLWLSAWFLRTNPSGPLLGFSPLFPLGSSVDAFHGLFGAFAR